MSPIYPRYRNGPIKLGKVADPTRCLQFRKKNLMRLSNWYWIRLDRNPNWNFFQLYRKVVDLLHGQFSMREF
ncbi:MAG TPA: hypothetical protein VNM22_05025 [Candidatus Limnocylindrales bacterium]|nr:hypothetical protein [Candidatus Limnocylindrales bacterium]